MEMRLKWNEAWLMGLVDGLCSVDEYVSVGGSGLVEGLGSV